MTQRYVKGGLQLKTGDSISIEVPLKGVPPPPDKGAVAPTPDKGAPPPDKGAVAPPSDPGTPVSGFPEIFKTVFKEILPSPVFKGLSDDDINGLLTSEQQQAVKAFGDNQLIPPHLFHGKLGKATVGQRVLMAGVILCSGKLTHERPGDEPTKGKAKPRATCCGHFAHWIWNYAGASPAGPSAQIDQCYVGAVTGATGAVYFSGSKYDQLSFDRRAGTFKLEPGDWLYICYHKDDDSHFTSIGDHSVIFSHWVSPGNAMFFSQRYNDDHNYPSWTHGGGDFHGASVWPDNQKPFYYVSVIMRPKDENFDILRTVKLSDAVKKNAAWMKTNSVDAVKLLARLAAQARERLALFSDQGKLTDFLLNADVDPGKKPNLQHRLTKVSVVQDEVFKPISAEQQAMIAALIDENEKKKGGGDDTVEAVTKLYALNQRMRPRWDSDGQGMDTNVTGLLEKDFVWPGGKKKTVIWELLGYPDKKAAVAELW